MFTFLFASQGPRLSSEFPRICGSVPMPQGQLHGPKEGLPCVVIGKRTGNRGIFFSPEDGTPTFPHTDCWSTRWGWEARGKWRLLSALFFLLMLNWMDQDWWTGAAFAHLLRKAADCILTDRRGAVSSSNPPDSSSPHCPLDTITAGVFLCLFFSFLKPSISIPSLLVTYECVSVKILLHK